LAINDGLQLPNREFNNLAVIVVDACGLKGIREARGCVICMVRARDDWSVASPFCSSCSNWRARAIRRETRGIRPGSTGFTLTGSRTIRFRSSWRELNMRIQTNLLATILKEVIFDPDAGSIVVTLVDDAAERIRQIK
jgi:hypothetical protein